APGVRDDLIEISQNALYPAIVRATALSLLRSYPGGATDDAMKRALADDEPIVRHTASDSLTVTDPEELSSLVAPMLFDSVRAVRMRAVALLAQVPRELLKPYQQEMFDEVLAEYVKAMEYSLDFSFAGLNLGNLYAARGELKQAERSYRAAIEIDDLFYPAKMNLAVLLSQQGRNEQAETLLREVLEAHPELYDAAYSLGLLLVEMGRHAEAVTFLRRAASGLPTASRIRYNLGLLLQQEGRIDDAGVELEKAVELEPDNLDYLYALTDHYIKRGRLSNALAVAERMIAVHPDNQLGHQLKALIERGSTPSRHIVPLNE
ncbi:MAG: tetratricopeptide repeat protein, partial [Acidobacteriota bacterium]